MRGVEQNRKLKSRRLIPLVGSGSRKLRIRSPSLLRGADACKGRGKSGGSALQRTKQQGAKQQRAVSS